MLFHYKSCVGLLLKVRSQIFVESTLFWCSISLNKTYYLLIVDPHPSLLFYLYSLLQRKSPLNNILAHCFFSVNFLVYSLDLNICTIFISSFNVSVFLVINTLMAAQSTENAVVCNSWALRETEEDVNLRCQARVRIRLWPY